MAKIVENIAVDPFAAFGESTDVDTREVVLPDGLREIFASKLGYFSLKSSNVVRIKRGSVEEAKQFSQWVRAYAAEIGMSTSPTRNCPPSVVSYVDAKGKVHRTAAEPTAELPGTTVTFRFSTPRETSPVDTKTVTITQL